MLTGTIDTEKNDVPPGVPVLTARRGWLACLSIICLGLILFIIAGIIVLALIPLYLPNIGNSIADSRQSPNLTYALPSSVQLGTRAKRASNQMMLVQSGSLSENQRATFQAVLQDKLNQDRKTTNMKIKVMSAGVASVGKCKITSIRGKPNSTRVRRDTPLIMKDNDIITVKQKSTDPDLYTLLNVDYVFTCVTRCADSLILYAINVPLVQLQFTASSFISLFYSVAPVPTASALPAMLLPVANPAIDMNSLINLQASYLQSLHYQQVRDPSINVNSYVATVDFEFDVPSIVFDHSSQIYIVSQSGTSIVFGFGSTDAFAQASAWPQSGIAVLIQGECTSSEAHDVFMLTGFIYNEISLTVAANYSISQVSIITSGMNVTIGRNTTSTKNHSAAGSPQNYSSDAQYVDSSFFTKSSSNLNNAYYANLNGDIDSALDDDLGGYYNSLSQALFYDIADPQDYDDSSAYDDLTDDDSSTDLDDIPLDPSDVDNATNADYDTGELTSEDYDYADQAEANDLQNLTEALISANDSASVRRRRRRQSMKWTKSQKILVRRKRGLFSFFRKIGKAVSTGFKAVVNVVKKAATVVVAVAKIVKIAIFGGLYEKRGQLNLSIGGDVPRVIYSANSITLSCEDCQVKGTVDIYGKFNFGKQGILTVLNEGSVETTGKIQANAVASITVDGSRLLEKSVQLAAVPLTPFTIPGIFTLGPQIALDLGASVEVSGTVVTTFGARLTWNKIYTKVDLKNLGQSQSSGWKPDNIEKVFTIAAEVTATLRASVEPKLELALDVLNGKLKVAAGFAAQGSFEASAKFDNANPDVACPGAIEVGALVGVDLRVYAEAGITDVTSASIGTSIFKQDFSTGPPFCIAINGGKGSTTGPDSVDSTTVPASVDSTTGPVSVDSNSMLAVAESSGTRKKRQVAETTSTAGTITSAPVDNITDIFFPQALGNFQLALESDNSIVVVMGNDYNMYLSSQNSTNTLPSTFTLLDLMVSNGSNLLIQDANNTRYLHSYGDVQDCGYGRLRTHLATMMPYDANIIFWTFSEGYMQLDRGGDWQYDTAGCLDSATGLVKVWMIVGDQGLSALQADHGNCGLAPLVPINY